MNVKRVRLFIDLFHCFRKKAFFFTNSELILKLFANSSLIKPIPKSYFSQEGQDSIALSLFKDASGLSIIDIGANHPTKLNNTYLFEKEYSAEVISIEPNPHFVDLYKECNRTLINAAIGNEETFLELNIPTRDLSADYEDNVHATFIKDELNEEAKKSSSTVQVPVKRLESLAKPGNYDMLFIDVEGFELQVLNGIDFEKFSFKFLFIENNSPLRPLSKTRKYLNNIGYTFYGRIHGLDDIYLLQ
tara:strand:- start:62 stop:799 length:738 start_codon:yes stop_codon:yes gene_type:complete